MMAQTFAFGQNMPFSTSRWIGISYAESTGKRVCPVFRKEFSGSEKALKRAELYVTALGLYEAQVNGKRVGDAYFTPGYTSYNKRLQYQKYDVADLLRSAGRLNSLEVTIGEGWYRGVFRSGRNDGARNNYGSEAGLLLELVLEYADGSVVRVCSDESWACAESGIRYSELYDGELLDKRYVVADWKPVKLLANSKSGLVPTEAAPVRKQEVFKPVRIFMTPQGEQVVDFGQNIAGWVQLKVKGKTGDTIKVSHAEVLDKEGNFYTGNLRSAKAEDIYVLKGKDADILEPHFTYHGFRYARISGIKATAGNCSAIALYTDLEKTGTFECSDPMLNRLQKNIEGSLNSNLFEVPTDCPQRSERLAWTGDAQVFTATASFLRNTKVFYGKWLKDLALEQRADGAVPSFVPTQLPLSQPTPGFAGWGDAAVIIPWTLYKVYGDTAILKNQYSSMKAWVDYINSRSVDGLWKDGGYGDWYAPGPATSLPFIDQCFWAYSCSLLVNSARVLDMQADANAYSQVLENIKQKFLQNYLSEDGRLKSETQAAYVLALQFGLIPDEHKVAAADRLVALIHSNNDHLATGFLATPYLLGVLSDNGHTDLAYALLMQKTYPSWLFPVTMGATTIWEKWDGMDPDGTVKPTSYNHYAYGAVGQWLYEGVLGIRATAPGYRTIAVKPLIGAGLTWAKGTYVSGYGKISVSWKMNKRKLQMDIEIPAGITAEVFVPVPDGTTYNKKTVGAGRYRFRN